MKSFVKGWIKIVNWMIDCWGFEFLRDIYLFLFIVFYDDNGWVGLFFLWYRV